MAEIIWGIDMGNSTTSWTPIKHMCKNGTMCELATEFGYCMVTACIKRAEVDNAYRVSRTDKIPRREG